MNKKTWLLIAIVSAIWICLFPLVVFGEGATYYPLTASEPVEVINNDGSLRYVISTKDTRVLAFGSYIYFVGLESFKYTVNANSSATPSTNATSYTKDGNRYYIGSYNVTSSNIPYIVNIPIIDASRTNDNAVYYTFGEGAVDPSEPVEPVNWGLLRDPSYTTRIAGSGQAARRNIDYLTWESTIDANGNDISECEVEIQAVYGKFTGSTLTDLWETDIQDLAISGSVSLDIVSASSGMYSVSWQNVINELNSFDFDSLFAHEVDQQIEKNGWYYQIRLLGPDDYVGQWQTLYTPLSMGAKASETIINQTNFDMSVYQIYQELSTINNNTSITINFNDTDYTINNPSDGTEPDGGTNLWDVLKELINGIFQILAKLGDLVGNLIDGLMGIFQNLFTPPEVDETVNNDINIQINNYIEDDQPGLYQIHDNVINFRSQIEAISDNYASGGTCILEWEDVAIDLSAFNAGRVVFIPGGTYDLKTAFINLLQGFGISYSTYQMLVSGVIYISLIVLISHKIKGFLKS